MLRRQHVLLLAAAGVMSACATPEVRKADETFAATQKLIQEVSDRVGELIKKETPPPVLKRSDNVWIPVQRIRHAIDPREQALLDRPITINREFSSLYEVAERLGQLIGAPVEVHSDLMSTPQTDPAPSAQRPSPAPQAPATAPAPALSSPLSRNIVVTPSSPSAFNYNGSVRGFLDLVAARYGLYWEIRDGKISLYRTVTRTFVVKAVPGEAQLIGRVGGGGGSGTGAGGSGGNGGGAGSEATLNNAGLSVWRALEDGVKALLSPAGRAVVTPSTGTITVTDTPAAMKRVEDYIEQHNRHLSRQVSVQIQVLSVALEDSENFGIQWNAIWSSLSGNRTISLSGGNAPTSGAPSLSIVVPKNATSAWAESEAVISALSRQGKVSIVTTVTAVTLNNQPVPVQVGRQSSYLESLQTSVTGNTVTTALTPGRLNTGFTLTVLPHILDSQSLLLQYSIGISDLLNLNVFSSGGSTIQIPEVESRNFIQRIAMRSGETLVLAGFEGLRNSNNRDGMGDPSFSFLGGGASARNTRNLIVILLRPIVYNGG